MHLLICLFPVIYFKLSVTQTPDNSNFFWFPKFELSGVNCTSVFFYVHWTQLKRCGSFSSRYAMCFRIKHQNIVKIFNLPLMLLRELLAKVDFEKYCTFKARSILPIVLKRSSKRDRFPGDILKSCSNTSNNFNALLASSVFLRGSKSTTANFKVSKSLPEMYDESSTRNFL